MTIISKIRALKSSKFSQLYNSSITLRSTWDASKLCRRDNSGNAPDRTALYDFHVQNNGKMVNFGGFMLPLQYSDQGIADSHRHTRLNASIFDVSHMLQTYVYGKDAIDCIESVCTADLQLLENCTGTLSVFTNDNGGILDDLIITKIDSSKLYIVSNAAKRNQDIEIMKAAVNKYKSNGKDVAIEFLTPNDRSLIAVQGPKAVATLEKVLPSGQSLASLYFMNTTTSEIAGISDCRITRCGYTGEDGVEISVDSNHIKHVTEALLNVTNEIKMAGLGARDSLRIEAGLCLYGVDIDDRTTPLEAGLAWLVGKRRRTEKNFPGAELITKQLSTKSISRRRIGLCMEKGNHLPPARSGTKIYENGIVVGHVTSGCPSPSLGKNIAMGYIDQNLHKPDNTIQLEIRNKFYKATLTRMPFLKTNYYQKSK